VCGGCPPGPIAIAPPNQAWRATHHLRAFHDRRSGGANAGVALTALCFACPLSSAKMFKMSLWPSCFTKLRTVKPLQLFA